MNIFTHFGSFCETSRCFDLSSRSLGHVIFSRETAQEAGAGGRSGAAGRPVHGSLMGCFSLCKWLPSLFSWSTVALWLALWCYQVKPSARWTKRKVKEAIYIKRNSASMNREQGYQLPPIYHQLLLPEQFPAKKSRDQGF